MSAHSAGTNGVAAAHPVVRWHNSLIFRVVLFCAVLLVCLFAAVYFLSRHYFREVADELESQAMQIKEHVSHEIRRGREIRDIEVPVQPGETAGLDEWKGAHKPDPVHYVVSKDGRVTRVAQYVIDVDGRQVVWTSQMEITPRTELLNVFRNTYMAAVTVVFVVTLVLMVFVINRALRPIADLSETCAEISRGNLKPVTVRKSAGEVRALEQTFNGMVNALREKEAVEAKLRQAQRLSALGNLAAGVAHDVRNPLNAIKLLSSHALDTLPAGADPDGAAKHLQVIRQEADRIEEIVSRFLSLAREREVQPEPVRVDGLLEDCLNLVRRDAEDRDVRLTSELRLGDTELLIDPKQWRRAVLNVLLNALEACPPGGRVRLFSRRNDSVCEIEIRDDGPGMDKETAERAFEPYFTTKSAGTGLGLAITRGIVEAHGGRVELSCVPHQGCQALITLPLEGRKV